MNKQEIRKVLNDQTLCNALYIIKEDLKSKGLAICTNEDGFYYVGIPHLSNKNQYTYYSEEDVYYGYVISPDEKEADGSGLEKYFRLATWDDEQSLLEEYFTEFMEKDD